MIHPTGVILVHSRRRVLFLDWENKTTLHTIWSKLIYLFWPHRIPFNNRLLQLNTGRKIEIEKLVKCAQPFNCSINLNLDTFEIRLRSFESGGLWTSSAFAHVVSQNLMMVHFLSFFSFQILKCLWQCYWQLPIETWTCSHQERAASA